VTIGTPNGKRFLPCHEETFTATTNNAATITWYAMVGAATFPCNTTTAGVVTNCTDNQDGTVTITIPAGAQALQQFTFEARGMGGSANGAVTLMLTTIGATKTSGAALSSALGGVTPELVSLKLSEDPAVAAAGWTSATWAFDHSEPTGTSVTVSLVSDTEATFDAPGVLTTTTLYFTAEVPADAPECTLTASVEIQYAEIRFDLPATIALNTPIDLDDYVTLTGAPADTTLLYTADGSLPNGVTVEIQDNGCDGGANDGATCTQASKETDCGAGVECVPVNIMTVTGGADGDTFTVYVSVFGTSGEIVFAEDTIDISAP